MRLTYTDLQRNVLTNTGNPGSSDTTLISFIQTALNTRYELMLAELGDYATQKQKTTSTVASQQYYYLPADCFQLEAVTIAIGSIVYPLEPMEDQVEWDRYNAVNLNPAAIPQYYFVRRDDVGIWPIPQAAYTLTLKYLYRDRGLTNDDYATGSLTMTNASPTVTGAGTTFTAGMVGRWLQVTTDGYWYRIGGYTNAGLITLETNYEGVTGSGLGYRIGETPELPLEAHLLVSDGATAEYFMGYRVNAELGSFWDNKFWTGSGNNPNRDPAHVFGGLLGAKNRYARRAHSGIVHRHSQTNLIFDKLWASKIS